MLATAFRMLMGMVTAFAVVFGFNYFSKKNKK